MNTPHRAAVRSQNANVRWWLVCVDVTDYFTIHTRSGAYNAAILRQGVQRPLRGEWV